MSKKIHGPDGHFYRVSPEGAERQTDQAGAHVAKSVNTGKRKPLTGEV
ncbi:MAG: hypothetical protein HY052_01075, partial [Proteobacteria bacterium]|nr:hypothetical protein [Pseudomonadota bacterium]